MFISTWALTYFQTKGKIYDIYFFTDVYPSLNIMG